MFKNKTRSPRPRKFNDWRIVNPISGFHKVSLYPRQGFNLLLDKPGELKAELGDKAQWLVRHNSELIVYEGKSVDSKGREVFSFSQKYDLDSCSLPTSDAGESVCLGSVSVVSVGGEGTPIESNLLIYISRANDQDICVVDPSDEYVQMLPHSSLRTIITQPVPDAKIVWDCEIDPYDNFIKLVSSGKGSQIISNWTPVVNTHLDSNIIMVTEKNKKKVCSADYFEFVLCKESAKRTAGMKPGHKLMTRLIFNGRDESDGSTLRKSVNVVLCVPKDRKPHKEFPAFLKETPVKEKSVDPMIRQEEKMGGLSIIVNPGDHESLELTSNDSKLCVQIALPKSLYPGRSEESRWSIGLENKNSKINLTSNQDLLRWGHSFQSVTVDISPFKVPESNSSGFIDALILSVEADDTSPPIKRRISLWYTVPYKSFSAASELIHVRPHELRIKRTGDTRRQTDFIKPAVATDLLLEKIDSKSFLDGLRTISICTTPVVYTPTPTYGRGHEQKTYVPQRMDTAAKAVDGQNDRWSDLLRSRQRQRNHAAGFVNSHHPDAVQRSQRVDGLLGTKGVR